MKVTWKNTKKKKKPCLPSLSHFTELPFEHDNDTTTDGTTVRSTDSDQSSQLAMQFQTQGDNLAMVLSLFITHASVLLFMFG